MDTVNEKTTYIVTIYFWDENGAAVTPGAAWYSLYCETTKTEILTETVIAGLGTSVDITITLSQNAIINTLNDYEQKLLTTRFTYGAPVKQGTGEYRYLVNNLKRIT
jgi:hypothetical protein